LHKDGDRIAWKSKTANRMRTEYWCSECAFPTCGSCKMKEDTEVERDAAVFVNLTTREWYLGNRKIQHSLITPFPLF
jgi:hypothetical protein